MAPAGKKKPWPPPEVAAIMAATCSVYGIDKEALLSHRRRRTASLPRHVAMYLARKHTRESLPAIGAYFGRDHTTVLHAVRKVADMLDRGALPQTIIAAIECRIAPDDGKEAG
jgi:chromosomal replication initiator protein